jgi:hypothetical protein
MQDRERGEYRLFEMPSGWKYCGNNLVLGVEKSLPMFAKRVSSRQFACLLLFLTKKGEE